MLTSSRHKGYREGLLAAHRRLRLAVIQSVDDHPIRASYFEEAADMVAELVRVTED